MARKWWALLAVCLGVVMLLVDITIVNVALPSIARDLGASFSDLQWVIDAYALSLAALLLIAGSLGDLLGHRRVYAVGLVCFTAASLTCGLASSPEFLIISRAAQGIGGAAMFASSLALLAHEFTGRERGMALGVWGATAGASVAVGPLLGGALTSGIGWRWVFFVNLPVGAVTLVLVLARVGETRRRLVRPDWLGAVAFSGALVALVFGLIRGNADGWASGTIIGAFAAGGLLLASFIAIERARREPMLELRLFRRPAFVGVTTGAVAIAASAFSILLYITLYLQNILGYSALQTGLRFLPITVPALLAGPVSGNLTERVPLRVLLGGGLALTGAGMALMARTAVTSDWTVLLPGMIVAGLGIGLVNPALGSGAVGTVPAGKQGVGSGINNTARQAGIAAGIAALGAVFQGQVGSAFGSGLAHAAARLGPHAAAGLARRRQMIAHQAASGNAASAVHSLPPGLRAPVAQAYRAAFVSGLDRIAWVAAAIALAGAVLALLLMRPESAESVPATGDDRPAGAAGRPDRVPAGRRE